jgi:hypothetical protein
MPRAEKTEWRAEEWPVMLDWVGDESLLRWPALPEDIEPRTFNDRSEEKWRAALHRDAYQYGSFILKSPEAWMAYRAAKEWHRESHSCPEDFRDLEDPEGTVSIEGAELLCHEQRMVAKRKLAWLGDYIAGKVAANDEKFLSGLARISKRVPHGSPPPPVQDPSTGEWREYISCHPQEGYVINAIFTFAGRNAIVHTDVTGVCETPNCREIFDFLASHGKTIEEREIRRIARKFGVPLSSAKVGRPPQPKRRNSVKKRPPSIP